MKTITATSTSELREAFAINLREVILRLIRSWRLILILTVIGLLLGVTISFVLPVLFPRYTAETYVLLTGARYQAKLDDKITTVDSLGNTQNIVAAIRADEYKVIAESGETAELALQEYKKLSPNQSNVSKLPGSVTVRVRGALVILSVESGNADDAVRAAKAYATATAARLDAIYGQTDGDRQQMEADLKAAAERLASDQQKLVDFYRTSRSSELTVQLQQRQSLRNTIMTEETAEITARLQNASQLATDLGNFHRNTETLKQQIESAGESSASLTSLAVALASLQIQLAQLEAGQPVARVEPGNQQPSTSPSATQPRTGLFDNQLRVDASTIVERGVTRPQLLADATGLLQVITDRETVARQDIAAVQALLKEQSTQQTPVYGTNPATAGLLTQLSTEEQDLRAKIQSLKDEETRLSDAVEQSKTAQSALASKAQELSLLTGPGSGQAIIASTPLEANTAYPSRGLSVQLTTFLGLMLGIAIALFRGRKDVPKHATA